MYTLMGYGIVICFFFAIWLCLRKVKDRYR